MLFGIIFVYLTSTLIVMKRILYIALLSLFVLKISLLNLYSQEKSEKGFISQVEEALKSASSKELSKFLHSRVEIKLDNKRKEYSINQAEIVLKDFFQRQPVSEAEFIHDGNSAGGMIYAIGSYKSGNSSFRLMVRAKKYKDIYKVYHLEFTEER